MLLSNSLLLFRYQCCIDILTESINIKMKLELKKFPWQDVLAVTGPLIIYTIFASMLSEWLIDDAGISFVYARNLAAGHGLVYQPGTIPIEGYSNPLWIFLMTPFFLVGIFDPFITSKIVSLIFVALSFWLMHKLIQNITGTKFIPSLIALMFLATNSSFVIWTASGLENPLFAFLIIFLLFSIVNLELRNFSNDYDSLCIGLIIGCISLTRPDGIVYATVYPLFLIAAFFQHKMVDWRRAFQNFGAYLLGFTVTFGTYFIFRILYFGDIYPNTYYVKGGAKITMSVTMSALTLQQPFLIKLQILLQSLLGQTLWLLIPFIVILWVLVVVIKDKQWLRSVTVLYMCGLSCFTYLILINDWMGEFRLATAFFPLLFVLLPVAIYQLYELAKLKKIYKLVLIGLSVVLLTAFSINKHYNRLGKFANALPASFSSIGERFGDQFNRYADYLELENASLLLPDIGGTLYYSKLRIHDLAGLCDPAIAKFSKSDLTDFYNYVFEELKPTFIHTHGAYTATFKLPLDERFNADYVGIRTYEDKYAEKILKQIVLSGNFVRRDATVGKKEILRAMQDRSLP